MPETTSERRHLTDDGLKAMDKISQPPSVLADDREDRILADLMEIAMYLDRIETRLERMEETFEQYRYLLPDPDSVSGRLAGMKARREAKRGRS